MFKTVESRYLLRGAVSAILTALATAATIWVDNPYLKIAGAAAVVFSGYLSAGALIKPVEPNIGRKMKGA